MFSVIGRHLRPSPAGVIAVMALFFAVLGGAYAATGPSGGGKATASAKAKKGQRGPRGPKGVTGPQGPVGSVGPAGPQGPAGSNGKDGATGPTGSQGQAGAAGKDGTFSTEPLPKGQTLTGAWAASSPGAGGLALAPISFPIEVAPTLTTLVQFNSSVPVGIVVGDGESGIYPLGAEESEWTPAWESACPGSADSPTAASGFLCVYVSPGSSGGSGGIEVLGAPNTAKESANSFGVTLPFAFNSATYAKGAWAVTAP